MNISPITHGKPLSETKCETEERTKYRENFMKKYRENALDMKLH